MESKSEVNGAQKKAEEIVEAVKIIGDHAEASKGNDTAVFTASSVDGNVSIAAAGSPVGLIKLLAHALNADRKLADIVKTAVDAAPIVGLLNDTMGNDDETPCDCPECTARRENAKSNVNVN